MNKVYFNPRCSKCKIAEKFMNKCDIKYFNYLYLEEGLSKKDILEILKKGNLNINQILRTNELDYKINIRGLNLSNDEKIDIVVKYPKILQRPIIVSENKASIIRDMKSLEKI